MKQWGWADSAERQWNLRVGIRQHLAICCVSLSESLTLSELLSLHHGDNKRQKDNIYEAPSFVIRANTLAT